MGWKHQPCSKPWVCARVKIRLTKCPELITLGHQSLTRLTTVPTTNTATVPTRLSQRKEMEVI